MSFCMGTSKVDEGEEKILKSSHPRSDEVEEDGKTKKELQRAQFKRELEKKKYKAKKGFMALGYGTQAYLDIN